MKNKKEEKVKPIEIYLDIYRCSVIVFCGQTPEEIRRLARRRGMSQETLNKKFMRETEAIMEEKIAGFCVPFGEENRDILVWVRKIPKFNSEYRVLYHELYHAVDMVFAGIDKNTLGYAKEGVSEPRAYLYDHLVFKCQQVLWPAVKSKKKKKK